MPRKELCQLGREINHALVDVNQPKEGLIERGQTRDDILTVLICTKFRRANLLRPELSPAFAKSLLYPMILQKQTDKRDRKEAHKDE